MLHEIVTGKTPEEADTATAGRRATDTRIQGSLDVVQPSRLAGWAMDQEAPSSAVEVDILLEAEVIATVTADRLRKDLAKAGIGTGRYGFEMIPERPLAEVDLPRLSVRVRGQDGVQGGIPNRAAAPKGSGGESALILGELKELRLSLAKLTDQLRPAAEDLASRADAIDVAQARLEASVARVEQALDRRQGAGGRGLGATVLLLAIAALLSLGLGIHDLLTR